MSLKTTAFNYIDTGIDKFNNFDKTRMRFLSEDEFLIYLEKRGDLISDFNFTQVTLRSKYNFESSNFCNLDRDELVKDYEKTFYIDFGRRFMLPRTGQTLDVILSENKVILSKNYLKFPNFYGLSWFDLDKSLVGGVDLTKKIIENARFISMKFGVGQDSEMKINMSLPKSLISENGSLVFGDFSFLTSSYLGYKLN